MIILKYNFLYKAEGSCIPDLVEFFLMDYSSRDLACPLMLYDGIGPSGFAAANVSRHERYMPQPKLQSTFVLYSQYNCL